jgi:polyhydroxybutyrate depolymerase
MAMVGGPAAVRRPEHGGAGRRGPRSSCRLGRALATLAVLAPAVVGAGLVPLPVGASPERPTLAPMSGSYSFTLKVGGTVRDYRLHVPPQAVEDAPLPLVLNLHGSTQSAILEEGYTDMDAAADHDGYLVAYPDGTKDTADSPADQYSWDAGKCCGLPVTDHIDDVGFLLRVIADIARRTPVDLRRVYVTGMSSGGMMAYTMAAEAAGHIAAIASVSGQVEVASVHPSRPVPTMEFHSVDDPIAKWDGTDGAYSVMDGIHQWVRADGCDPTPHDGRTVVGAPGTDSSGETATLVRYTGCRDRTQVALWRLTGSGHVWPGSPLMDTATTPVLTGVGRGTTLIDANQLMWAFFSHYSLPRTPGS